VKHPGRRKLASKHRKLFLISSEIARLNLLFWGDITKEQKKVHMISNRSRAQLSSK